MGALHALCVDAVKNESQKSLERLYDSQHITKSTIVFDCIKATSLFESM